MGTHEEEPGITLEEEIRILQEQGLPPEKIVERILEEDLNADVSTLADTLKLDKLVIGRIKGRLSRLKKRREEKAAPTTTAEAKAGEEPLYKGELDTTSILKEILTKHPDIPTKVVEEVCSWAEFGPIHPTQLVSLLQSFRGITATTAYIVAQKYSLALQKAQLEGKLQMPPILGGPMPTTQSPQWNFPQVMPTTPQQSPMISPTQQFPQQTPTYAPQQTFAPSWPQQDIRSIIREELRGTKEPRETEQYVDIEEPVRDSEGKVIIGPDDRAITKRMRVPASQASQLIAPREDVEERVLNKMKTYKDLFGPKEELTMEKIRGIIRDEMPTPTTGKEEKPITVEDVKTASTEASQTAVKQVLEAHEKDDKEERRHHELLNAVRESTSTKTVEGYKEDSFRILGHGLSEAASVVRERKPIEVLVREGGPLLLGGPPGKEVEAGAGEGLLKRLKDRGWVTEQ